MDFLLPAIILFFIVRYFIAWGKAEKKDYGDLFRKIGWFFISLFFLSLFAAIAHCPPGRCAPEAQVAYFLPFTAFFTVLPLGLLCLFIGKTWVKRDDNGRAD